MKRRRARVTREQLQANNRLAARLVLPKCVEREMAEHALLPLVFTHQIDPADRKSLPVMPRDATHFRNIILITTTLIEGMLKKAFADGYVAGVQAGEHATSSIPRKRRRRRPKYDP